MSPAIIAFRNAGHVVVPFRGGGGMSVLSRPDTVERDFIWLPAGPVTAHQILRTVAERRGVTVDDITGNSRSRTIAHARHEACWEMKTRLKRSFPWIAQRVGLSHHTSVMHAVKRHAERIGEGA